MKFKHRSLLLIAGCIWFAIGTFLLVLGLRFIMEALHDPSLANQSSRFSLLSLMTSVINDRNNAIVCLITLGLLLGFVKGRTVLRKTVQRQLRRIATLPTPAHLKYVYTKGHYLLILAMIALGTCLRFLPITLDTRGVIDIAVGSALMNGALVYFRCAVNYEHLKNKEM